MRVKASTVGNIVGKTVPVSMDEVRRWLRASQSYVSHSRIQDNNAVLRTWHPDGPNAHVEKKSNILAHHEVLLRLDAIDLERGKSLFANRSHAAV